MIINLDAIQMERKNPLNSSSLPWPPGVVNNKQAALGQPIQSSNPAACGVRRYKTEGWVARRIQEPSHFWDVGKPYWYALARIHRWTRMDGVRTLEGR